MTTSMIDLPENLQPASFLRNTEDGLTDRSLAVVSFCKGVWRDCRWQVVEEASREAEELWCKYGEQTGHAIAFLWLADLYWRHGKLENATRHCERAIEHIPNGPAPVYRIAKAVAHYMCGLSYQMSGEMSAAFASYQEALELFQAIQNYWNRTGNNNQGETYEDVLGWIRVLREYISHIRLDPLVGTDSPMTLVCPWRKGIPKNKYILAELALAKPVNVQEIKRKATQNFVTVRRQSWYSCGGIKVDCYKIRNTARVMGLVDGIKNYRLNVLNPAARYDRSYLVLPTGVLYYSFQVDGSVEFDGTHIEQGDYLLAWSGDTSMPDRVTLEGVGEWERDPEGRVHFKPKPVILGSADFDLHAV